LNFEWLGSPKELGVPEHMENLENNYNETSNKPRNDAGLSPLAQRKGAGNYFFSLKINISALLCVALSLPQLVLISPYQGCGLQQFAHIFCHCT
jgi:hypothetical protein